MSRSDGLKARLRAGDVLIGGWNSIGHTLCAESLVLAGAAYVALDQQHGEVYSSATGDMIAAVAPHGFALVRVAANDPHLIGRALDQGADGVMVPLVEDVASARALQRASQFPPIGTRSFGGRTRGMLLSAGDPARANERVTSIAIIESAKAVANIDSICRDGGIDAVYIGLNDLAISLGLEPRMTIQSGAHADAVARVAAAAAEHGIAWGTHSSVDVGIEELAGRGAQLITACTDLTLIDAGAARAFACAPGYAGPPAPDTRARETRSADRTSAA